MLVPLGRNRTSYRCNCARGGNEKKRPQTVTRLFLLIVCYLPATLLPLSRYNGGVLFRIRQFEKADFDTLWRIDQACFDPQLAYSRPEMAFYMRRPGSFTLVAEAEGGEVRGNRILGFIVAETRRKSGHIITIDVVAEVRRAGVGSALLRAAEDRLLRAGVVAVALETPVNNATAIRFYKQKGYFVEKRVAGYYSGQMDALVMTKELVRAPVG
jgi:ribosomal protein S18 acetylase RimI-like enzyme